ncbi:MAG: hypothetical protein ACRDRX_01500 [Pseudonocardiaceae bacterium]
MNAGQRDPTESWVPDACRLPVAERPLRVAEFDDMFATAVLGLDRPEPARLRLNLKPTAEVAAGTAALVRRETACCSFFVFTLTATGGQLLLEVTVPPAHIAVLDALSARAALAMSDQPAAPS